MLRLTLLFAVALLADPLSGAPPTGIGDDCINGVETYSSEDWGMDDMWDDAMFLVQAYSPSTASDLNNAIADGTVNIVGIQNPPNPTDDNPTLAGSTDENTLGVDMVGRNAAEVAATIIHEWQHFQSINNNPPVAPGPCAEANAYASQIDAAIAYSCEISGDPPTCEEFDRIIDNYVSNSEACLAESGSHSTPISTFICECT